jgi:putative FmdB family regulatory protein
VPLYEFRCKQCGHVFEKIQSYSAADDPCPRCAGEVERLLSAPAIQFKGSGFYLTDYGKAGGAARTEGSGNSSESGASSGDNGQSSGDKGKAAQPSNSGAGEGSSSSNAGNKPSGTASPSSSTGSTPASSSGSSNNS